MNLLIYLLGVVIVVCAMAYGAHRLGLAPVWIGVGAAIMVGLGLMAGVVRTRQKDRP